MSLETSGLAAGQYKARMKLCEAAVEQGLCLTEAADKCSLSPAGLLMWLRNHAPKLGETLAQNGMKLRGGGLTPTKTIARLTNVVKLGQSGAAGEEDVTPQAIHAWLKRNGFHSPRADLAELLKR